MKKLFSPWRSAYIQSFAEEKKSKGCLLCRIQKEKKDSENLVIWRGKYCYAVLNKFPYNAGHLMIVPYRHNALFSRLTKYEHSEVMELTSKCIDALDAISRPHGYNFGANLGRVAGAGIDKHIHFHIVPRWNGDTNFMPTIAEIKMVSENMNELHFKLIKSMKSIG